MAFLRIKSFGGNLAAIKFGVHPPLVYAVYDRRIYWRRQILAKTRNSPNIIARQNLLIYSIGSDAFHFHYYFFLVLIYVSKSFVSECKIKQACCMDFAKVTCFVIWDFKFLLILLIYTNLGDHWG